MNEHTNNLVVIGLDALINEQFDIDRLERAFYKGVNLLESSDSISIEMLSQQINESVCRLAANTNCSAKEIDCIIICENNAENIEGNSQENNQVIIGILSDKFASIEIMNDLGQALSKIQSNLSDNSHSVAIIGINHSVNSESELSKSNLAATIALDTTFQGYHSCQGLVSLLFTTTAKANNSKQYIYATIKAVSSCDFSKANISKVTHDALNIANISAEDIELLELSALDESSLSNQELKGLVQSYQSTLKLQTAISSVRSVLGDSGGLSQVAGLLKTIIAVQQQTIHGIRDWHDIDVSFTCSNDKLLEDSAFYFPTESRPWYPNPTGQNHLAAYSCLSTHYYSHIIIEELQLSSDVRSNGYFATADLSLILLVAADQQLLMGKLKQLADKISFTESALSKSSPDNLSLSKSSSYNYRAIKDISQKCYQSYLNEASESNFCVALIAENLDELKKELTLALTGIEKAIRENAEWKTPKGSYFTSLQSAKNTVAGKIAFLYPGIGATYVGLGRDLFHLFPEIVQPVANLANDIGETLKDKLLNPRSINKLDFKSIKKRDSELRNNLAHIAECGVGFACAFTKIFEDVFNIKADLATGYSMGEVSMYASLGCWQQPGLMSARLAQSETFNLRLSGELSTLRSLWKLPKSESGGDQNDEKIWETYSIRATAEDVAEKLQGEDRVFTTIINTPDNLLIGGYPDACEKVIARLGVRAMAMDMPNAIHSEPARADYADMEQLFSMEVNERISTTMLSSSCYLPIPQRSKAIANSIAKCLCDQVDFPRLIDSLYDRGARIFIEIGAGRSLCSWTDKIIKTHYNSATVEHTTIPVNAKGTSDELTFMRAVAKLVSHGVDMDLQSIFTGTIIQKNG